MAAPLGHANITHATRDELITGSRFVSRLYSSVLLPGAQTDRCHLVSTTILHHQLADD